MSLLTQYGNVQCAQYDKDVHWMRQALALAQDANLVQEVPVGAVLVHENTPIAQAHNRREAAHNPLAHAEILAIEEGSRILKRWRLHGCTLYVTLEPCLMCAGALIQSRIDRLVYCVADPKAGAVESIYEVLKDHRFNHRPQVEKIKSAECQSLAGDILKDFFARRRKENSKENSKENRKNS